jgi:hypothetical protein
LPAINPLPIGKFIVSRTEEEYDAQARDFQLGITEKITCFLFGINRLA